MLARATERLAQIDSRYLPQRYQTKRDADHQRRQRRETKHTRVDRELPRARKNVWAKRNEQLQSPTREHQTQRRSRRGQQRSFEDELWRKRSEEQTSDLQSS